VRALAQPALVDETIVRLRLGLFLTPQRFCFTAESSFVALQRRRGTLTTPPNAAGCARLPGVLDAAFLLISAPPGRGPQTGSVAQSLRTCLSLARSSSTAGSSTCLRRPARLFRPARPFCRSSAATDSPIAGAHPRFAPLPTDCPLPSSRAAAFAAALTPRSLCVLRRVPCPHTSTKHNNVTILCDPQ